MVKRSWMGVKFGLMTIHGGVVCEKTRHTQRGAHDIKKKGKKGAFLKWERTWMNYLSQSTFASVIKHHSFEQSLIVEGRKCLSGMFDCI